MLNLLDKSLLKRQGYIKLSNVVPDYLVKRALRSIHVDINNNGLPKDIFNWGQSSSSSRSDEVMDLYYKSPLKSITQELTAEDLRVRGRSQVALRFPQDYPSHISNYFKSDDEFIKYPYHMDGLYDNDITNLDSFSMLLGVYLSDVQNDNMGELAVASFTHASMQTTYHSLIDYGSTDDNFIPNTMKKAIDCYSTTSGDKPKRLMVNKGDAIICNPFLLHKVAPNYSYNPRYAVYFRLERANHIKGWHNLENVWSEWSI